MAKILAVTFCVLLVVVGSFQQVLSPEGVYLGSREDRAKLLEHYLEPLTQEQRDAVNNSQRVLREGVGAYKQTLQVLIQACSIVHESAVSGTPKCDNPPKDSCNVVERARDECISHLVQFNRDVLNEVEVQQQQHNELTITNLNFFEQEMIKIWGTKLLECTSKWHEDGLKKIGVYIVDYIKCTVAK